MTVEHCDRIQHSLAISMTSSFSSIVFAETFWTLVRNRLKTFCPLFVLGHFCMIEKGVMTELTLICFGNFKKDSVNDRKKPASKGIEKCVSFLKEIVVCSCNALRHFC